MTTSNGRKGRPWPRSRTLSPRWTRPSSATPSLSPSSTRRRRWRLSSRGWRMRLVTSDRSCEWLATAEAVRTACRTGRPPSSTVPRRPRWPRRRPRRRTTTAAATARSGTASARPRARPPWLPRRGCPPWTLSVTSFAKSEPWSSSWPRARTLSKRTRLLEVVEAGERLRPEVVLAANHLRQPRIRTARWRRQPEFKVKTQDKRATDPKQSIFQSRATKDIIKFCVEPFYHDNSRFSVPNIHIVIL